MNKINISYFVIISLIFFASLTRIIPHMPNFTPIGAMALFGGAYLNNKYHALIYLKMLAILDIQTCNYVNYKGESI